jgi:hypothetical protein
MIHNRFILSVNHILKKLIKYLHLYYVKYQPACTDHDQYWVPMGLSLFYHMIIFAKCYLAFQGHHCI